MQDFTTPLTIDDLLDARDWEETTLSGELLQFSISDGCDVYNITPPFVHDNTWLLAGRVEARNDEFGTKTHFFKRDDTTNTWIVDYDLPELEIQDPFITLIDSQWVVGGVRVLAVDPSSGDSSFRTEIYAGKDLHHLRLLAYGPVGMKDIRLVQLEDSVGIFTRPQGKKGGLGKIGFTRVRTLGSITTELLEDAPLITDLLSDNEWGGVNEAHLLPNGEVGVLGHIARQNQNGKRAYYVMSFIFNPETRGFRALRIIASRGCFPETAAKRDDLYDIVFPGGIRQRGDEAIVYAGLSDTSAGAVRIPNPFALA